MFPIWRLQRRLPTWTKGHVCWRTQFWPGPLTLVLPVRERAALAPAVTAGLETVALRCPAHPVMQQVLAGLGHPLAAPSANRSETVSPTAADHVLATLDGRIDGIIDGGQSERGLESTIVAIDPDGGWSMLRPGPITEDDIAAVLGEAPQPDAGGIRAPGQLAKHYAPGKPLRLEAREAREAGIPARLWQCCGRLVAVSLWRSGGSGSAALRRSAPRCSSERSENRCRADTRRRAGQGYQRPATPCCGLTAI